MSIEELDNVFTIYGYEVCKESDKSRAYLLKQGMYFGAEIFSLEDNAEKISNKYKDSDYACKIEKFKTVEEAEEYLFSGFFQTELTKMKINDKYSQFAEKQVKQYNDSKIKYEYISVPYQIYDSDDTNHSTGLIDRIGEIIEQSGAYLIIVEAAAGFGKTCTAFELYKSFEKYSDTKRPLFTELTRNRTQKLFKYVLRDEVEREYKYGINTGLVIHNIKKGRIPFIVDGFDELLTKDIDKGSNETSEFEEVETMLSTIGELLTDNAKIILTSRKTAIFAGEDFSRWVEKYGDAFKVIRFQLEEPNISNWLNETKLKLIEDQKIPINYISNPVLLTYLKNIDENTFIDVISNSDKITDKYFDFLLEREKVRQNIIISKEDQFTIYQNLAKDFYRYDINCDERDLIKLFISEDNSNLLLDYRDLSPQSEDELLDTLANHALLDRYALKNNKEFIGFINDFVYGYLLGEAIVSEGPLFLNDINNKQLEKVFESYKYCGEKKKEKLWNSLLQFKELFEQRTKVSFDINLKKTIIGSFYNDVFHSYEFNNLEFTTEEMHFKDVTFTNTTFHKCTFDKKIFENTYFTGCTFSDCGITNKDFKCQIHCYGCEDYNSNFISRFQSSSNNGELETDNTSTENVVEIEKRLLSRYFKVDKRNIKMRLISTIKDDIKDYDINYVYRIFHSLKKRGFIKQNGNNSHITKEGTKYYGSI